MADQLSRRTPPATTVHDRQIERLRTLAHWLDDGIPVPGTGFRFGVDAILDIVPVLGDFAGVGFSSWILLQASRMGASKTTLLRMLWNIGVDALVGIVPAIGVFFDAAWKANLKNVALLEGQALHPAETHRASRKFAVVLLTGAALLAIGAAAATWFLLRAGSALLRHTF